MKVNNKIEPKSETDAAGFAEPVTDRSSDISDNADKLSDRVELVGDRKTSKIDSRAFSSFYQH